MRGKNQTYIEATPNHAAKTFTLRIKKGNRTLLKYRTVPADPDDFYNMLYNTSEDWGAFLNQNLANTVCYQVKRR